MLNINKFDMNDLLQINRKVYVIYYPISSTPIKSNLSTQPITFRAVDMFRKQQVGFLSPPAK